MLLQLLRTSISPLWLVPVALMGMPFLLGALGRLGIGLGAERLGHSLRRWAVLYGELPAALFGGTPLSAIYEMRVDFTSR